jgi:glutamate-1-semialdehyde 2,1-aminomutase
VFAERGGDVAAVFVEPIAANMGVVAPGHGFLRAVVDLSRGSGAIVVFDEVVTGFRIGPHGAQGELHADLTMFGKVIGGGLPIGAVGGRADLMDLLAPVGPVYQAGTYAAHPHAMAAGAAVLSALRPQDFASLEGIAMRLFEGLAQAARDVGVDVSVVRANTFGCAFFSSEPPRDFADANATDKEAFARFHRALRSGGVLIAPSPFEAWFPSLAHSKEDIERTVDVARSAFAAAKEGS